MSLKSTNNQRHLRVSCKLGTILGAFEFLSTFSLNGSFCINYHFNDNHQCFGDKFKNTFDSNEKVSDNFSLLHTHM